MICNSSGGLNMYLLNVVLPQFWEVRVPSWRLPYDIGSFRFCHYIVVSSTESVSDPWIPKVMED